MPFEIGNKLGETSGGGRKGYEFELEQMDKMTSILTKYLAIIDKILDDEAEDRDYKKIEKVGADVRKILDKIHASRTEEEKRLLIMPIRVIEVILPQEEYYERNKTTIHPVLPTEESI